MSNSHAPARSGPRHFVLAPRNLIILALALVAGELVAAVAGGGSLARSRPPEWKPQSAVTTVIAADGYPEKPRTGDVIHLPSPETGVEVFHAGTARTAGGELVTAGGRVLAITAVAPDLLEAAELSGEYAERVSFKGKQLRRDIGWRELTRGARIT